MTAVELGISEAARACNVDRATVKRRLRAGRLPNARQDDRGIWRIPVTDLLAAGLSLSRTGQPDPAPGPAPGAAALLHADAPGADDPAAAVLAELRAALAGAEHRAELAEQRAQTAEQRAQAAEQLHAATVRALGDALTLATRQLGPAEPPRKRWRWRRSA